MHCIDLIIFDLDGTLVDSKEAIAKGINFVLRELGLQEKDISAISSYIGTGVDDLISKSLGRAKENYFEKTKSLFENYRQHSPDNSRLYPGVKETLEYFKNKRKSIVTNRKYEFALPTLKNLGIYDYFEDILGADDIACKKPSSCPLDRAITKFNIHKEKTIIVGDMDIDILAGKSAGILTCAVTYGIGRREDILKANPDYIIDDLRKLKEIIN